MPENPSVPTPDSASPSAPPPPVAPSAGLSEARDTPSLFVAHSLALAVQDATDNIRRTATVANTATGVALARFLATGDATYLQAIEPAQRSVTQAIAALNALSAAAAATIRNFPVVPPPNPPAQKSP